ncbi:MAG: methyltransferase domain-containing protein [Candidatus Omnitrophota bacterium]
MLEQVKLKGKSKLFFNWMPENKDSLLDIGCAYSFMLNLLGKKSKKQFGLDFDLEKINEAKYRFSHICYVGGSGQELPYKDNSFDIITFFEVLEHVDNEKFFLEEIYRVLKPSGIIMLSVPNKGIAEFIDIDNVVFTPILWFFKKLGLFKDINNYYLRYHRHYSLYDLKNMFKDNFRIEKVYYGGLFLNQIGFLIYKTIYVFLLLFKVSKDNKIFKKLAYLMDEITSWDFDHSFGKISDKLCIYAKKYKNENITY